MQISEKITGSGENMYNRFLKRAFDLFLGIIAAIILFVPMLAIAVAIKVDDPKGKVFFKQTRIGRNGKKFKIFKFRSMKSDTPKHLPNHSISPEEYSKYVTKIGNILRKYSLDELPQIFNIIKGDMSWVGPRPVIVNEKELLAAREKAGLSSFRPGLTGWAQVNGRNALSDEEKARYDAEYVSHISFLFDLSCIVKTIPLVVSKEGFTEGVGMQIDQNADFESAEEFVVDEPLTVETDGKIQKIT